MNYKSAYQMAKKLSCEAMKVSTQDVQRVLQELDYLDKYYKPTLKAMEVDKYKIGHLKGKEYIKWCNDVQIEVMYLIHNRYFK